MKQLTFLVFANLLTSLVSIGQCKLNYSNYNLVFEENFNNITSPSQLTNRWMFQHDDPGWGWGGDDGEYYNSSQVSIVPGGILRLTAVRLSNPVPVWSVWKNGYRYCNYKSGMIQLRRDVSGIPFDGCNGKKGFTYGYV